MNKELEKEFTKVMNKEKVTLVIYKRCPFCGSNEIGFCIPCNEWDCNDCKRFWKPNGTEVKK